MSAGVVGSVPFVALDVLAPEHAEAMVGWAVGEAVGEADGDVVGEVVGEALGEGVGGGDGGAVAVSE